MIATTGLATRRALTSRGAPVEYWFFRAQSGRLAFLIDLIVRRRAATAEVRLGYWVRGAGTVSHDVRKTWDYGMTA